MDMKNEQISLIEQVKPEMGVIQVDAKVKRIRAPPKGKSTMMTKFAQAIN